MKRGILYGVAALVVFVACGEDERVADGAEFITDGYDPAWGPDGRIAYVYEHGLWVCDAGGGNKKRLSPEGQKCFDPDWRPDGKEIVYLSYNTGGGSERSGLYVLSVEGGTPRFLTDGIMPAWSPNGDEIAFSRIYQLLLINPAGGEPRVVLEFSRPENIAWAPDGEWLFFAVEEDNYKSNEPGKCEGLWRVKRDGTGLYKLLDLADVNYPACSPEGNYLAYSFKADDIFIYDIRKRGITKLTSDGAWEPSWSPEGRAVAFASSREGGYKIYKLNVND